MLLFHLLKIKNFCRTWSVPVFHYLLISLWYSWLSPLNILNEAPGQTKRKNVLAQQAVQVLLLLLEDWNSWCCFTETARFKGLNSAGGILEFSWETRRANKFCSIISQGCQALSKCSCAQDGNVLHKKDLSFLPCYSLPVYFETESGFSKISMTALEVFSSTLWIHRDMHAICMFKCVSLQAHVNLSHRFLTDLVNAPDSSLFFLHSDLTMSALKPSV